MQADNYVSIFMHLCLLASIILAQAEIHAFCPSRLKFTFFCLPKLGCFNQVSRVHVVITEDSFQTLNEVMLTITLEIWFACFYSEMGASSNECCVLKQGHYCLFLRHFSSAETVTDLCHGSIV